MTERAGHQPEKPLASPTICYECGNPIPPMRLSLFCSDECLHVRYMALRGPLPTDELTEDADHA
jgi:hypothetical protein